MKSFYFVTVLAAVARASPIVLFPPETEFPSVRETKLPGFDPKASPAGVPTAESTKYEAPTIYVGGEEVPIRRCGNDDGSWMTTIPKIHGRDRYGGYNPCTTTGRPPILAGPYIGSSSSFKSQDAKPHSVDGFFPPKKVQNQLKEAVEPKED
jgi:hypothetical protein